jgi:predicted MFS family arabinose efflux permease
LIAPATRAAEWRAYWPLVLAAMVGFAFNSLVSYSGGLFMGPLEQEFGWGRTLISSGTAIGALFSVLFSAPVGGLIDRWGPRPIALPGLILAGCSFAAFGLASGSPAQWLGLWLIYAVIALSTKSTMWVYAVSSVFTQGRSMALAFALGGSALAQIVAPPLTYLLIERFGWRGAYAALGLGWGAVAFVLCLFFLKGPQQSHKSADASPPPTLTGLTLREAFRDTALIRIGLATLLTMFVGVAVIAHQVPILTDAGMPRGQAASIAGLAGVAAIAGKLITGWAMERFNAGWVGSATLAMSALAFALLLVPGLGTWAILAAMMIIGYSGGTKLQISAYLTGCYSGMKHFGAIFGVVSSLVALGSALGPLTAGYIYDTRGSYAVMFVIGIAASLASGLLIFRLGAYSDWQRSGPVEALDQDGALE